MKPKVLLLDDNSIVNFISRKTIEDCSFSEHITEFTSGKRAIKYLEQLAEKQELIPDLIFLDIKMQLMDGFEFLDHFGNLHEAVRKKSRIVMLTSSLLDIDRERALKYDYVVDFLNKPVTRVKLEYIKNKLIGS